MNREQFELLSDNTLRIEKILSIGGMQADGSISSDLTDFFDGRDDEFIKKMFPHIPDDVLDGGDDNHFGEGIVEYLLYKEVYGYIVEFAHPVKTFKGSSSTYSWGYYNTKAFYVDSVDDSIELAVAWSKSLLPEGFDDDGDEED
jgi:hypothetical protein